MAFLWAVPYRQPMRHEHGFREATPLATARERFLEAVTPVSRTETVPIAEARGRTLAADVVAERDVPHYDRAAMDGWALRAADTHGASARSPRSLSVVDGAVGAGEAARVHTGSAMPPGSDAVVMVEDATRVGERVEVTDPVAGGRHVGPAGEDVEAGSVALEAGHALTPSALALCRSLEVEAVEVYDRPEVAIIPTGEELVLADPAPGEVVETNGLMVAQYVASWGGRVRYRDVVTDDPAALREAIRADLDADLVVTTGGSSVGARDHLPEVLGDLGEVLVHGVAIQPGHPVGLGRAEDTPVALLPGYPVSCAINAVTFVRPAVRRAGRFRELPDPTVEATLTRKVASRVGQRTFARVRLRDTDGEVRAEPVMTSGAGILSSLAATDAVVEVPEAVEGYDAGERVEAVIWE